MSLFAAYAEQAKELENTQTKNDQASWLNNSSFKSNLALGGRKAKNDIEINASSSGELGISANEAPMPKKKKREKRKKAHKKDTLTKEGETEACGSSKEVFTVDRSQTKEYLTVMTISKPVVCRYRTKYYLTLSSKHKKRKFRRYFKMAKDKKDNEKSDADEEKITKGNINMAGLGERDENFTGFTQEEQLSKTTAFYNKTLAENPSDTLMWLKYVDFQNDIHQFEKSYRKGSIAKAQRVLAERKIAILDKALTHNPGCEALLRQQLKVAVSAFPADELQVQLKKLVEKEKENIILWQGYIEATQCSMSHCNSPAVLSLYSKCLSTLHQLRRTTLSEKYIFEESILRMLYQCGLYLKQAGLFEQLWTLLKMYLELNLSPADKGRFTNIEHCFNEKELLELEEIVFTSQLPHTELWLRTEKLRESCHWLPYTGDQECVDPQRVVFNEDVVELIQPITMPENIFKLVATSLTLLKIPLLPCRHSTMQDLGLDYVPWSLDSVEALLPVFINIYPVDVSNENLLKDTSRLAVGPQYLKVLPGQEEYLNFVLSILETCADCMKGQDQIAIRIWWFRFLRLLIILDNQNRFKMPIYLKKNVKMNIKELLKREEHRNNEIFYTEYALIEKACGNSNQCLKILKTALGMNKNKSISTVNWSQSQANQCHLYRNIIETIIEKESDSKDVLNHLVKLVLQRNFDALNNGLLMEADTKFKMVTNEILESGSLTSLMALEHFLPDFFSDWIVCHGWFLFWNKGPLQCGTLLEDVIAKLEAIPTNLSFQIEIVYEFYCSVLLKYCLENPGSGVFKILDNALFRAVQKFPNNLYFLAILAKEQSLVRNMGISAWKVQDLLLKTERSIAVIFSILINELVRLEMEKDVVDPITGNSLQLHGMFKYKILSLYKRVTKPDMCTRRCGLIWRMYLQFVDNYFDPKICRNVYYSAVEECPWFKALYMDAAVYIPADLAQIQDLIIEKQLRLHVTPEELDILRS